MWLTPTTPYTPHIFSSTAIDNHAFTLARCLAIPSKAFNDIPKNTKKWSIWRESRADEKEASNPASILHLTVSRGSRILIDDGDEARAWRGLLGRSLIVHKPLNPLPPPLSLAIYSWFRYRPQWRFAHPFLHQPLAAASR